MTNEEFRAKVIEIIDNEQFANHWPLFDYKEIDELKVAQLDEMDDIRSSMPFMNFIDELYKQIKEKLC